MFYEIIENPEVKLRASLLRCIIEYNEYSKKNKIQLMMNTLLKIYNKINLLNAQFYPNENNLPFFKREIYLLLIMINIKCFVNGLIEDYNKILRNKVYQRGAEIVKRIHGLVNKKEIDFKEDQKRYLSNNFIFLEIVKEYEIDRDIMRVYSNLKMENTYQN